jgi:hypothetical protein
MKNEGVTDVHTRDVSVAALDAIRPLARRRGFRHTNSDAVRFAVRLTAEISRCSMREHSGLVFPLDFKWPAPDTSGADSTTDVGGSEEDHSPPSGHPDGAFPFP